MSPRITGKAAHKMRQYLTVIIGQIDLAKVALLQGKSFKVVLQHLEQATQETSKLSAYITAHIQEYKANDNNDD